jgi:ketosteroid isomerase-like protein
MESRMSNKDVVRQFYDAIDNGDIRNIGQLCTTAATFQLGRAPAASVEQFIAQIGGLPRGSSRHVIRELIAEGDKVACHVDVVFTAEGGESNTTAMTLFTFTGGKIASELVLLAGQ